MVEVQLRVDAAKHHSWPGYLFSLRARLRSPVVVLVICTSDAVARWAEKPISLGPGSMVTPTVLGPAQIPVITDAVQAREAPELTLLSAVAHPDNRAVVDTLFATLTPDSEHSLVYADLVRTVLPEVARRYLEDLMTTSTWRYQSDFARKYFDEGEAKGKAEDVLAVLQARGITVSPEARARVTECTDTSQLSEWLIRAVNASHLSEVFD